MRLRDYTVPSAVPHYSCAITPGRHCPLFGAAAVLRGIAGATLIYIGTQDCVYYAQKDALTRQASAGKSAGLRTLALQLSDSDLIFGIRPQLQELLEQEAAREGTGSIFLVTSCSVEVISEDLRSVVEAAAQRTGKHIALIPTENFKTFSYIEGIEDTLNVLTEEMSPCAKQRKTFAVLGARQPGAENCEPVKYLRERGYELHSILPYEIDAERLKNLPGVEFTIVVDGSGVDVGERMQKQFGVPCVRFDRKLDLRSIIDAWRRLSEITGLDAEDWLQEQIGKTEELADRTRRKVQGKTFFYGQKVIYPFEACRFLTELGMIPACIFVGSVIDKSDEARLKIAEKFNPVIWQNANQAAIEAMLKEGAPDYCIGIVGGAMRRYPVAALYLRVKPIECGFEFYRYTLEKLLDAEKTEVFHETV